MRFYSLIWHINEEAFGVRQRPGGSYRRQRCCSTPRQTLHRAAPSIAALPARGQQRDQRVLSGETPAFSTQREDKQLYSSRQLPPSPAGSQGLIKPQHHGRGGSGGRGGHRGKGGCKSGWGPSWPEPEPASKATRAEVEHQLQGGSKRSPHPPRAQGGVTDLGLYSPTLLPSPHCSVGCCVHQRVRATSDHPRQAQEPRAPQHPETELLATARAAGATTAPAIPVQM